jgi:capsular exopolysaccharide synthesis family protein
MDLMTLDGALVAALAPNSPAAEAYRTLRTNVQFASIDAPLRSILVTAVGTQEDKSAVAANLAISLAQGGSRVVLVDADLRRPRQHVLFGLANDEGLTSAVLPSANQDALPLRESGVDNLQVLTAGTQPANPADLLGSQRMAELLERLKASADILVLDSPPALAVTDAAVLARRVDGVLLVVRSGKTKRDQAAKARRLLERVNARILGAVLTDAKVEAGLSNYYG